ncbi:uncharacterized protein LOC127842274 [Dreissena polymorpha]|uniref:Uncharacterized protein n=1 Tax=Dreissena polymorpha TaxID=45954 RepID=A0A9D4F1X6_DREPO|nr:uncharacterized protein LOC127842274 [Dreissena polymorpha]KAH3789886.1 hypothetical protein DPMN_168075 [Dreissena polymorpha]
MPHDIGPELRLARPRNQRSYVSAAVRHREEIVGRSISASGFRKSEKQDRPSTTPVTPNTVASNEGEYHIELLEYEWPDLPPIVDMKDAVCRQRVSQGITYILPVDKGRNSIDNKYRTDLRAMFQEPYATEGTRYDDTRIIKSAKIHFRTNVVDTRWTVDQMKNIPITLNTESENARKIYAHSAPVGGRARTIPDDGKIQTRSSLYLPIKNSPHLKGQKIRKKLERISRQYLAEQDNDGTANKAETPDDDKDSDDMDASAKQEEETPVKPETQEQAGQPSEEIRQRNKDGNHKVVLERSQSRKSIVPFKRIVIEQNTSDENVRKEIRFSADEFESYEQLKATKPPKQIIPDMFKSEFLSNEKNQGIWDWLHYGESISDFEYFLSVCG